MSREAIFTIFDVFEQTMLHDEVGSEIDNRNELSVSYLTINYLNNSS